MKLQWHDGVYSDAETGNPLGKVACSELEVSFVVQDRIFIHPEVHYASLEDAMNYVDKFYEPI